MVTNRFSVVNYPYVPVFIKFGVKKCQFPDFFSNFHQEIMLLSSPTFLSKGIKTISLLFLTNLLTNYVNHATLGWRAQSIYR